MASLITGGGDCVLACVDRQTGKTRKSLPHSKTGICPVCLKNLGDKRGMSAPKLVLARKVAETAIHRIEEVKEYPKGYAVLGGRPVAKRK